MMKYIKETLHNFLEMNESELVELLMVNEDTFKDQNKLKTLSCLYECLNYDNIFFKLKQAGFDEYLTSDNIDSHLYYTLSQQNLSLIMKNNNILHRNCDTVVKCLKENINIINQPYQWKLSGKYRTESFRINPNDQSIIFDSIHNTLLSSNYSSLYIHIFSGENFTDKVRRTFDSWYISKTNDINEAYKNSLHKLDDVLSHQKWFTFSFNADPLNQSWDILNTINGYSTQKEKKQGIKKIEAQIFNNTNFSKYISNSENDFIISNFINKPDLIPGKKTLNHLFQLRKLSNEDKIKIKSIILNDLSVLNHPNFSNVFDIFLKNIGPEFIIGDKSQQQLIADYFIKNRHIPTNITSKKASPFISLLNKCNECAVIEVEGLRFLSVINKIIKSEKPVPSDELFTSDFFDLELTAKYNDEELKQKTKIINSDTFESFLFAIHKKPLFVDFKSRLQNIELLKEKEVLFDILSTPEQKNKISRRI